MIDTVNGALRRLPTWPLYIIGTLPMIWLLYAGVTGGLGVDPVKAMEHQLGLWALWLLIAGLCISPLQRFAHLRLVKFRRAVGLLAFFYVVAHLLVWLVLDLQFFDVWKDILKRPYVTIGMAGFALLIPLALTSNNRSVRWLGASSWQRLHKLTYGAVLLGAIHFVMLAKGWQIEPLLYLAAIVGLLALRAVPKRRSQGGDLRAATRA